MSSEHVAEFVVVGSGIGGLTAAIVAADAGLRVVVIERADTVGGVSGVSGGLVYMPGTRYARERGITDSPEDVERYLELVSAGYGEARLRRRWIDKRYKAHAGIRITDI